MNTAELLVEQLACSQFRVFVEVDDADAEQKRKYIYVTDLRFIESPSLHATEYRTTRTVNADTLAISYHVFGV